MINHKLSFVKFLMHKALPLLLIICWMKLRRDMKEQRSKSSKCG